MGERTRRVVAREVGLTFLLAGAALTALGCGGGDVTSPTTGTLAITTATSGPEPDADGYAVTIDDGTETAIAASATIQRDDVEPGNHSIRLSGMAANCTLAGENPRSVSVPAGEAVTVTFELTCGTTSGSLRITSTTSGPSPDADGYTMTVDGADRGALVASGAVTLNGLPPGNRLVGLSGVAGNCQVQGDNPRSITIVAGASATAAFEIVCAAASASTGSLKISTATTGADLDSDGYSLVIDAGATQSMGLNTTVTLSNIAAGAHQVRLSGVATNCRVGDSNPRSVTISAGATVEMSFAVSCTATTGSIEITTTTKGAKPDPDGYTVSLDNGNPQPITTGATVTVAALTAGPHTVALAGLAANCRVEGENPRTITLTAGQKATITFSVLCPTFATYRATDLGTLGGQSSSATDINSAGQVVGWSQKVQIPEAPTHAVLWENGVTVDLTPHAAGEGGEDFVTYDQAAAINSGGQVVGTELILAPGAPEPPQFPWLWEKGRNKTSLGVEWNSATDINTAGQVVGCAEAENSDLCHAALWENGMTTDLGTLGGEESEAYGIDPAGRVVGWSDRADGPRHAFLWENGVMTDLNIPGDQSGALAINAAGQVVGYVVVGRVTHGFVWKEGTTVDLGEGVASDINAVGQVVGMRVVEGVEHAFVWEDNIFTDLPGPSRASGINDAGRVVGSTGTDFKQSRATLWTPE